MDLQARIQAVQTMDVVPCAPCGKRRWQQMPNPRKLLWLPLARKFLNQRSSRPGGAQMPSNGDVL
jgi:hypothetical protein